MGILQLPVAYRTETIYATSPHGSVSARMIYPPEIDLSGDPALLLTFSTTAEASLSLKPHAVLPAAFAACGHRAISIDLPNHGSRIDEYGSDIDGWRNAFVAGDDRFALLVEEASAVIDHCIEMGYARPGRIAAAGTSRGGYMALRLFAADKRIAACAALSVVTDWRSLAEFSADVDREDVANLRLSCFAEAMVGRPVFLAIANHDLRVSTQSCCQFYLSLVEANRRAAFDESLVEFHCTTGEGHRVRDLYYELAGQFLLDRLAGQPAR
jgi:hypothetical protein